MNGLTSTSIPVKGDRKYVMTMKALAAKRGTSVAALVREALDDNYGDELRPLQALFDAPDDASIPQIVNENSTEADHVTVSA
jgi:hypothetical protein